MLGLRKGTVRVVDYQESWAEAYDEAAALLEARLMGIDCVLEHIGSTAVVGLAAKPILDIAIGVGSESDVPTVREALAGSGWIDRGDKGEEGGWLLVMEDEPGVRTHHAHVVVRGSRQWSRWLGFRDALRSDAALRDAYAARKRELEAQFGDDRGSYTAGKAGIIDGVVGAPPGCDDASAGTQRPGP